MQPFVDPSAHNCVSVTHLVTHHSRSSIKVKRGFPRYGWTAKIAIGKKFFFISVVFLVLQTDPLILALKLFKLSLYM